MSLKRSDVPGDEQMETQESQSTDLDDAFHRPSDNEPNNSSIPTDWLGERNGLLERGDVAGEDDAGRTVTRFAVDDWLLEQLLTFDAGSEQLEDNGDAEPDDDAEENGPPY
jgi:hypothetical protein